MDFDQAPIAAAIERALGAGLQLEPSVACHTAFHMTDWLDDLSRYAAFCAAPDDASDDTIIDLLMRFLAHVPAHLNAAHELLMDEPVPDVFGESGA